MPLGSTEMRTNNAAMINIIGRHGDRGQVLASQGCSAVDITLKEGIEKTLLSKLPQLKAVRDVTDHSKAVNAYM